MICQCISTTFFKKVKKMSLTKKVKIKKLKKSSNTKNKVPSAPKHLTESTAMWNKVMKGRKFSYIDFKRKVEVCL